MTLTVIYNKFSQIEVFSYVGSNNSYMCICQKGVACRHGVIKYQLHMVEQSPNITAEASLSQESTTPDLLPGSRAVTAARSSSGLLYLSKAVRNEWTRRTTKLQRRVMGLLWRTRPFPGVPCQHLLR